MLGVQIYFVVFAQPIIVQYGKSKAEFSAAVIARETNERGTFLMKKGMRFTAEPYGKFV